MIDARNVNKAIKYKAKAIPFKAYALNTPRYLINIPDINCSLLSSGINMKLLVLISILYSIADTECIVSIKRSLFDHKHIYIF